MLFAESQVIVEAEVRKHGRRLERETGAGTNIIN